MVRAADAALKAVSLERIAPADDADDDHDHRNDQEDVDEATEGVRRHHPEQPQNYEKNCDRF
jgi:hypothetical protein